MDLVTTAELPTDDRAILGEGTSEAAWNAWPGLDGLPSLTADMLMRQGARVVVVAPHPDDEVLSVGGLLTQFARRGMPVQVIAVTDGTASHEGSRLWPSERLARVRPKESRAALACLGITAEVQRLGLADGQVQRMRDLLADRLMDLLLPGDLVFTTWRRDGHPDHEATGHACAFVAARIGARLFEVPVWAWHWAEPGDARLPWRRAHRVALDPTACSRKRHAVQAFQSQLHGDASTGAGPILRASTVQRASRRYEVLFA